MLLQWEQREKQALTQAILLRLVAMPVWVSSSVHRAVVNALIDARKASGITQRDLAAKVGKPPSFVGKVEAIERNLSILEFMAWTQAMGVDGCDLLRKIMRELPGDIEL